MESLWDVDRDVSTAILLVFIRRWGQLPRGVLCSTLVRCYWCISILSFNPTLWCCSLIGPHCNWPAVVLFDCRYPCFRNFNSTISIDFIWMKSYMDSFLDPSCVPVRVTINKLDFFPNELMPRLVGLLWNCGGLRTSKPYVSVMFFYSLSHSSPCFSDIHFAAFARNLRNNTVLFCWFPWTNPNPNLTLTLFSLLHFKKIELRLEAESSSFYQILNQRSFLHKIIWKI